MPTIPDLSSWYGYAKNRVQNRRIYRSGLDIAKAFFLRATTPNRHAEPRKRFIPGLRLHLNGLADPVYLRTANSDFMVFKEIFEDDEYRPAQRWNLPPTATVLDLGGNIGLATVYFGGLLNKSRIVTVEPDAENCAVIRQNNQGLIRAGRLRIVQSFIAARDGSAGIDRNARSWAFKMTSNSSPGGEQISCITLPSLIRDSGFEHVDLLKCDIEGTEAEVFANCGEWVGRVSHLIVETHSPYRNTDLHQHLRSAGWEFDVLKEVQEDKVGLCFLKRRVG